jgi:hypothetical protein
MAHGAFSIKVRKYLLSSLLSDHPADPSVGSTLEEFSGQGPML